MKVKSLMLSAAAAACLTLLPGEAEASNVDVYIDNEQLQPAVPARIEQGTTLVPMRAVFQALDADVYWNQQTKEIASVRGDRDILLTLGRDTAIVNGERVTLRRAPFLDAYTTMVPLRFVSEALGDRVTWNQQEKTVRVTKNIQNPEPEPPEVRPITGSLVEFDRFELQNIDTVYMIGGRSYVPVEPLVSFIDSDVPPVLSGNELRWNDKSYPLVEEDGTKLIAASDFASAVEGTVRWTASEKKLSFSTGITVYQTTSLDKSDYRIPVPTNVEGSSLTGERRLLTSNSPESIYERDAADGTVLWHDGVSGLTGIQEHRVYGHHHNRTDSMMRFAVTIENTSAHPLEVYDAKRISSRSARNWPLYDIGLELAGRTMNDTMQSISKIRVEPGETKQIVRFTARGGEMLGYMNDFSVMALNRQRPVDYTIRTTAATGDTELTELKGSPVKHDGSHARGSWAQSDLSVTLPDYYAGDENVSYSLSNRNTDHFYVSSTSYDPMNAHINPGHFGAEYHVTVPLANDTEDTKTVGVYLSPRGGSYAGAVNMDGQTYLTPPLAPVTESVLLKEIDVEPGTDEFTFDLMHTSGSNLPIAVSLRTMPENDEDE
ncbi:copper amine oxidase N-terminal domain-containing protein [Alkalicoccus urumqiensis]|uniref:Copper amine oxidase-like N-terminal domain-containing protein n=1 Tax=Alkalicoccus urumqiensis TaxID=1548213 RepID=A0A2P6MKZ4_ALKUR|nr:copper amine oxidase N-terminal domain-containing protein [Alkalicoccus urumqiensis]PRO66958.1 hypothetical protein C6I21_03275 [Alkalicoccus urumqiensis]